ncbi:MAG TPA: Asp23/Gls24 family envelope stress response protein [Pseudonocardia sp.]|nr:Asp23/Gls24 family envelope stress response protein [Pseudonocardia sp.]
MSTPPSGAPTGTATATRPAAAQAAGPAESALATTLGSTRVADTVVAKIAGLATVEVAGVYALGGGAARALGALRERIPGATSNVSQGVTVEVGERQAAVDLDLVVEYGVAIADLARSVRRNVIGAIERMTGLEVVEVNVVVNDVHLPSDDGLEDTALVSAPRVS